MNVLGFNSSDVKLNTLALSKPGKGSFGLPSTLCRLLPSSWSELFSPTEHTGPLLEAHRSAVP